jgi:peptidoglycan/LPS O-acetylase OafA/YrhL
MKRSFGIDLVRTVAILIVMLRHYGLLGGFNFGIYAIEFLFVVSGYLIGQILIKSFYSVESISFSSVKLFMMRRWFRILPMYYLAILIKFIFFPEVGKNIIFYLLFLQNNFYGISFFPETWSLVIDEWFYLGTPILLYMFMKFISFNKKHILIYLCIIIVIINILRWFWVVKTNIPWTGVNSNIVLHQDTLLIGVILAYIKQHFKSIFDILNTKRLYYFGALLFSIFIYFIFLIRWPNDRVDDFILSRTITFSIGALIIAMMLPYIENRIQPIKIKKLSFVNKIVTLGSKYSYALYLFHGMSLISVHYIFDHKLNITISAIIALLLSIFISYLLYEFVEKKFLILRDRYYPEVNPLKI